MNSFVEQVARAIFPYCTPLNGVGCCNDPDFDKCVACVPTAVSAALAAIEAVATGLEKTGTCADQDPQFAEWVANSFLPMCLAEDNR